MNALVTLSARFYITPDGLLWTPNKALQYSFWTRYFDVYDGIKLTARIKKVTKAADGWYVVSGPGVWPVAIPYYKGPNQYLMKMFSIRSVIKKLPVASGALHMRVPGMIENLVTAKIKDQPYGVEVVGDPYDIFAPGSVRHPLRPFFRCYFTKKMKEICYNAAAAAYVTESALQKRYPVQKGCFSTHYSSIELSESDFIERAGRFQTKHKSFRLVSVGSLNHFYKAPDILIEALIRLKGNDKIAELVFIGDGIYKKQLEELVNKNVLADMVKFKGYFSRKEEIQSELDQADLFILPSRQEGLPKALIEAMARGLPCIGSTAGGIPELLGRDVLVPPGDAEALARKIEWMISNPQFMAAQSKRNLEKAGEYTEDKLRKRRIEFYSYVKERTLEWQKSNSLKQN
ncbi:MAG: glycosyltransferase [Balneolaceae bacterium]